MSKNDDRHIDAILIAIPVIWITAATVVVWVGWHFISKFW